MRVLDTEKNNIQSVIKVVAKFGKTYDLDLRSRVLGAPELDGAKMVVNELNLPISVEEYINMVRAIKSKVMSDVDVLPGFYYLFCYLKKIKINAIQYPISTNIHFISFVLLTNNEWKFEIEI